MVLLSHTGCTSLLTVLALGLPTQCFPYLDCFIEFVKILLLFYDLGLKAHDILVARPGIKPANLCIGRCSLNYWITRQVPYINYF